MSHDTREYLENLANLLASDASSEPCRGRDGRDRPEMFEGFPVEARISMHRSMFALKSHALNFDLPSNS